MKQFLCLIQIMSFLSLAKGQVTFVYDQQSSSDETPFGGNSTIQTFPNPYGQSFIPSLNAIDFIKLQFSDAQPSNAVGATLYVNLRENSIGGIILGSSTPNALPDAFVGVTTFLFSNTLALTPSATYFFEPVVQSGDNWNVNGGEYNYPQGSAFFAGLPQTGSDFWFREGTISVPEPSSVCLGLAGAGALVWFLRRRASASG
ncbi:MAG: PEP-CTERM sorting domain-containing protein [Verrucomicrobia bacterium]|nr:PEP-CTERM sorting domain-containing protein [Verrucomicrobiota bacterium]